MTPIVRFGLSVLAGALACLALPPVSFVPILFLAVPLLLWLAQGVRGDRMAFAIGWGFGMGYFVPTLYWTAWSMTIELDRWWWAIPFAILGLPAYLALFHGGAMLVWRRMGRRGALGAISWALCWTVAEGLRGWVLTGFPWNAIGYAWVDHVAVMQAASVVGTTGLGLLTVALAGLPVALFAPQPAWRRYAIAATPPLCLLILGIAGQVRLAAPAPPPVPGAVLRIVQTNTGERAETQASGTVRAQALLADLRAHVALSQAPPPAGQPAPTHVIWPEAAASLLTYAPEDVRPLIAAAVPRQGLLFAGGVRIEPRGPGPDDDRYFNSLAVINAGGEAVAWYDKAHLVPFGEYWPLGRWFGLGGIATRDEGFAEGDGRRSLRVSGVPPVSPLICYEVIFEDAVADRDDRPGWLLNVTNDSWFGETVGPYQHWAKARARAVEEGLPVVRAAVTGISGVIDSRGRVEARLGLGEAGVIDSALPGASSSTAFARGGPATFCLLWLFLALLLPVLNRYRD